MAQAQARTEEAPARTEGSSKLPVLPLISAEFVEQGKKHVEHLMEIQKELFETIQEINLAWFERARSVASLNSELVAKLSAARTVPETADACQESMGKRMEQFVDDSRQLMADGQKIVNLGKRFLTNGSASNRSAA